MPIIFVHRQSGSAQQFESQAMRFTSNGFPQDLIFAYEYDTSRQDNTEEVWAGLDADIGRVKARTGARKVDVLAHSRGTTVMHGYLGSSTTRARSVRNNVNYDGRTSATPPGGVRALAVWGEGDQSRRIGGAGNVYLPNQAHTQSVSSPESFRSVDEFLTGRVPQTTQVRPERTHRISLAGRSVFFQENLGPDGARLGSGRRLGVARDRPDVGAPGAHRRRGRRRPSV